MRTQTMNANDSKLKEFFVDQLQDMYWGEKKLVKALPKLQNAATSQELKETLGKHLEQTKTQVSRLENIFNMIGQKANEQKCEGMAGIVEEAEYLIDETDDGTAQRDVALIFAAQKIEHYEIATYGGLATLAKTMEISGVADLLGQTLNEEKETDALLTQIAMENVNYKANEELVER